MDMHAHLARGGGFRSASNRQPPTEHRLAYSNRPAAWASMV
jgi:hypothetical protein